MEIADPWVLLATAEQRLSSSLTGLLIAGVPLVGGVLAASAGGERLGGRRLMGLLVGLAGRRRAGRLDGRAATRGRSSAAAS